MKNNLGRVFLTVVILLHVELFASSYMWSAKADKNTAMTNEAIYLEYTCKYDDPAELYLIEFNPVTDNERYTIILLSEKESLVDGKKVNRFEFLAYVKKPGLIEFVFDTTMKKTNQDSIENTVLGRDNADYEEFTQRMIRQEPIIIGVKDAQAKLVGDFNLKLEKNKQNIKAYEPYGLDISIDGIGNFEALKAISFKIPHVKVFAQKPIKKTKLTKDGYVGSWNQKFAFVSDKDFRIPKQTIKYFDLNDRVIKKLVIDEIEVEVEKTYKKEELLDENDSSSSSSSSNFIYYVLTFLAGFLFSKVKFQKREEKEQRDEVFEKKIKTAKSLDELMIILTLQDSKKYEEMILKIERKEILSLKDAKKELIKKVLVKDIIKSYFKEIKICYH